MFDDVLFICKHEETLVTTIRCNLTKACRISVTFTESFYRNMGILYLKNQEFSPVYRRIIRSSTSLSNDRSIEFVRYKSDPHSKDYNSISILYFLCLVPV